jgi:hypothetical protein
MPPLFYWVHCLSSEASQPDKDVCRTHSSQTRSYSTHKAHYPEQCQSLDGGQCRWESTVCNNTHLLSWPFNAIWEPHWSDIMRSFSTQSFESNELPVWITVLIMQTLVHTYDLPQITMSKNNASGRSFLACVWSNEDRGMNSCLSHCSLTTMHFPNRFLSLG